MPYRFHQDEGTRQGGTGTRTVAAYPAADQIRVTPAQIAGLAVGDIVEIRGDTTAGGNGAGNNGFYTIRRIFTTTVTNDTLEVWPQVLQNTPGGTPTCGRLNRFAIRQVSTAIANFLAGNIIEALGALFVTQGIQRNERVIVAGATGGGAANNGGWYVKRVLSETQIEVKPLLGSGQPALAVAAGTGTVTVRVGAHTLRFIDEAVPDFPTMGMTGVPQQNGATTAGQQGAGPITDFVEIDLVLNGDRNLVRLTGVTKLLIDESATNVAAFLSTNQIVVSMRNSVLTGSSTAFERAGVSVAISTVSLGNRPGDRFSCRDGASWHGVGMVPGTGLVGRIYGSMYELSSGLTISLGPTAEIIGSVLRPRYDPIGGLIESVCLYNSEGSAAFVPFGAPDAANLLIGSADAPGVSVFDGGVILGLLISDNVTLPFLALILTGQTLEVRNPRQPYLASQLFTVAQGPPSLARVTFLWNRRFVFADPIAHAPVPQVGMQVRVFEVVGTTDTEIAGSPFTTDINGRLAASVGVILRRHTVDSSGIDIALKHRFTATPVGFCPVDDFIITDEPDSTDYPLHKAALLLGAKAGQERTYCLEQDRKYDLC